MNEEQRLHQLMLQFRAGSSDRYVLRLWRECGLRRSATIADQIRVAEEVLADTGDFVASPWIGLRDYLIGRFNDPDAEVRDGAIQDLVIGSTTGFGFKMGGEDQIFDLECTTKLIQILVARLRSPDCTYDDRVTAAWLLPKLGMPEPALISVFLTVLAEMGDGSELSPLRLALMRTLTGLEASPEQLAPHVQQLLRDRCTAASRRHGVFMATEVGKRDRRFLKVFSPDIELLLGDADTEVRSLAGLFFARDADGR